jgi:tetratricopeptide (TPR) repeat protein
MRNFTLILALLIAGLTVNAQTGKELKKQGDEAYKSKNYPKAVLDYSRAIEAYKSEGTIDTSIFYNATIAAYKAKNYEKIIPFSQKAIELGHEKSRLCYYIQALAHDKQGNDDEYFVTLVKGHEAYPGYSKIGNKLAIAYLKKGTEPYNEAANIIKEAEQYRESDTDKYMAELERANKKFKEALESFEKAYEANAEEKQVLNLLLSVYKNLEMESKANKINSELQSL